MKNKKVLLFGGGGVHDFKACCPVLKGYLDEIDGIEAEYVAEDYDVFREERIKGYSAAVIYHTGKELDVKQKRGLVEWCAGGGGLAGIHGAADSFKSSPEYLSMLGGVFKAHPFFRKYIVSVNDETHPAVKNLRGYSVKDWEKWPVYEYEVEDEQYLTDYDPRNVILASTVFRGRLWPVAWVKGWGKGKVCYIALGHSEKACSNGFFMELFKGGIEWLLNAEEEPETAGSRFKIGL